MFIAPRLPVLAVQLFQGAIDVLHLNGAVILVERDHLERRSVVQPVPGPDARILSRHRNPPREDSLTTAARRSSGIAMLARQSPIDVAPDSRGFQGKCGASDKLALHEEEPL